MDDISVKYNLLDKASKRTVNDLVDFLLLKQKQVDEMEPSTSYKSKILRVPTWSEEDVSYIQQNQKWINEWKVEKW